VEAGGDILAEQVDRDQQSNADFGRISSYLTSICVVADRYPASDCTQAANDSQAWLPATDVEISCSPTASGRQIQ
jgi:hypothetical protein